MKSGFEKSTACSLILFFLSFCASCQDIPEGVNASADTFHFDRDSRRFRMEGNVKISYQEMTVTADQVSLHTTTYDFHAQGKVRVSRNEDVGEGDMVKGNFKNKTFQVSLYRGSMGPWFTKGKNTSRDKDGIITGEEMSLSTCEFLLDDHPHWQMDSKKMRYHPEGKFTARHVVYRFFNIPIFYLPIVAGNTVDTGDIHVSSGYSSTSNFFLELGKDWQLNDHSFSQTTVTYRTKRGFSLKNTFQTKEDNVQTDILAYIMHDQEPLFDRTINEETFNGGFRTEADRFRLRVHHNYSITEKLKLTINMDAFSDNDVLFEFFKHDFQTNPQPTSQINLIYNADRFALSLRYRPRLNDVESVVERLPEFQLTIPRQSLAKTNVYYQGTTTVSQLKMKFRSLDLFNGNLPQSQDYTTERLDSLHFLYYPFPMQGIQFTPRMGGRFTYYAESSKKEVTIPELNSNFLADDPRRSLDNPHPFFTYDNQGGNRSRFAMELGIEAKTQWIGNWSTPAKIQHLVEPFVNYTYIPSPNVDQDVLFFFDEIDRVDKTHFTRFGARHRITKEKAEKKYTLARMEHFIDVYLSPEENRRYLGDLGGIFAWDFRPWSFWVNTLFDVEEGDISIFHTGASLKPTKKIHWDFSYFYRQAFLSHFNHSMGSDIIQIQTTSFMPTRFQKANHLSMTFRTPLNHKTSLRMQYFFDLERERIGRQVYELNRTLHCWTGSLRFEENAGEISVLLILSLRAFPKVGFDIGV